MLQIKRLNDNLMNEGTYWYLLECWNYQKKTLALRKNKKLKILIQKLRIIFYRREGQWRLGLMTILKIVSHNEEDSKYNQHQLIYHHCFRSSEWLTFFWINGATGVICGSGECDTTELPYAKCHFFVKKYEHN